MKKICFVCSANECRSQMAEAIFKNVLKKRKIKDVRVSSAGLGVLPEGKISDKAKNALEKLGIKVKDKKSKQLKQIYSDTIYLTMTKEEKDYINKKNVLTLGELIGKGDIEDPYFKDQNFYDSLAKFFLESFEILADKLQKLN